MHDDGDCAFRTFREVEKINRRYETLFQSMTLISMRNLISSSNVVLNDKGKRNSIVNFANSSLSFFIYHSLKIISRMK